VAVYYNEIDRNNAAWLQELMDMKLIAFGEIDTRSIKDVDPTDLKAFTQWHLFAGIGTWSYALKQAGWPDDREVLTGSCPCTPFSNSGQRKGFDDPRHLWPEMLRFIRELRPSAVFGEQVASKESLSWWDVVAGDLEVENYAAAAMDLPAACVGAPHVRSRLFWVADKLGDTDGAQQYRQCLPISNEARKFIPELPSNFIGLANPNGQPTAWDLTSSGGQRDRSMSWNYATQGNCSPSTFWSDAVWLQCRDGKLRPTGAEINPLVGVAGTTKPSVGQVVDGVAARVGHRCNQSVPTMAEVQDTQEARMMRLKGYGNAIVAPLAIEFITTFMEI
jgi:DNA (cytosine-5)-methyltransferase 1